MPGMPNGKPAGKPCIQLLSDFSCAIFGDPSRPQVCEKFMPEEDICGKNKEEATTILAFLEDYTCTTNTKSP
ncbi:YkgJ family cysteine cluster protein [Marinomonas ushuaiensis]|uniref:YkgJ family cysteine cluster protein n=1 Tax=Marinomonas ushuaiensis TaxID=263818 RepID=UPI001FE1BBE7|nr:YkgJ family cysteine cluster protein [Marinomonas ushuaiensis]